MNIRILAASALALAILVPAANAASPQHARSAASQFNPNPGAQAGDIDHCPNNNMNLGTLECLPIRAKVVHARVVKHKVVHARVVKHVVKPVTAFERMTENVISHDENVSH
jgi:hypothetical protein